MNGRELTASQEHDASDDGFEFGDFTSVSAAAEEAAVWGFQVDDTTSGRNEAHDEFGDFSQVEPYVADFGNFAEAGDMSPSAGLETSADEDFGAVTLQRATKSKSVSPADEVPGNIESQDASDSVLSREVNFDSESMASSITTAFSNVIADNRSYDERDLDFEDAQRIPKDKEWHVDKFKAGSQDDSRVGDSTEAQPGPAHLWDTSPGDHSKSPEKLEAAKPTVLPPADHDAVAAEQPKFDGFHSEAPQRVRDASEFADSEPNQSCGDAVVVANQPVGGVPDAASRHENRDEFGEVGGGNEQVGLAYGESSTPPAQVRVDDAKLGSSGDVLGGSCNCIPQMAADQPARFLQEDARKDLPSESQHDENIGSLGNADVVGKALGNTSRETEKVTEQAVHDEKESSALPGGASFGSASDVAVNESAESVDFRQGDEASEDASERAGELIVQSQVREVRHMADSSSPEGSTNSMRETRDSSKFGEEIEQVAENAEQPTVNVEPCETDEASGSATDVHFAHGRADLGEPAEITAGATAEIGETDAGPSGCVEKVFGKFEVGIGADAESGDFSGTVELGLQASLCPPTTHAAPSGDSEADLHVLGSATDTQDVKFGDFAETEEARAHIRAGVESGNSRHHGIDSANVDVSRVANDQQDVEVNTIGGSTEIQQTGAVSIESGDGELSKSGAIVEKDDATNGDCGVTEEAMTQAIAHVPATGVWSSGSGEADFREIEAATATAGADPGEFSGNKEPGRASTEVPAADASPAEDDEEDFGKFEAATGEDVSAFGDFSGFEDSTAPPSTYKPESHSVPHGARDSKFGAFEEGSQDKEHANSSEIDVRMKHGSDEASLTNDVAIGASESSLDATKGALETDNDPGDWERQCHDRKDFNIPAEGDKASEAVADSAGSSAPLDEAEAALGTVIEKTVSKLGEVSPSVLVDGETEPNDEDDFGDFGEAEEASADKSGESDFGEFGESPTFESHDNTESAKHGAEERDTVQDSADDDFGDYDNAPSAQFGKFDEADSQIGANDSHFGNFEASESSIPVKANQALPQEDSDAFGDFDNADFSNNVVDATTPDATTVTNGALKSLLRDDVDLYERASILLREAFNSGAATAVESDSKENCNQLLDDAYDVRINQLLSSNNVALSPPSTNLPSNLAAALLAALALSPAEEEEADRQRPAREVFVASRSDREDPRPASPTDGLAAPYEGDDVAESATASFPLDDLSAFLSDTSKPNAVAEAPIGAVSDFGPTSASIATTQSTASYSADDATWNFLESMSTEEPRVTATRVLSEPSMFSLSRDTSTSGVDSTGDLAAKPISTQFPSTESMQESVNLEDQILASLGVNTLDSGGLLGVPPASSPSPATSKNARKVTLNSRVDELPDYSFLLSKALVLPLQVSDSTDMESDSFWS